MRILVASPSLALVSGLLLLTSCAPRTAPVEETVPLEGPGQSPTLPASIPKSSPSPTPAWQTYQNSSSAISVEFPSDWYGPDVFEVENQLRLAVGSDVVFPYGTQPETTQVAKENSYQVVIQYTRNSDNQTLEQYRETQPWFDDYLSLLELKDGDSVSTPRSVTTRVRGLESGGFTGAEFISTVSGAAQTEPFYSRSAFLHDEHLNVLLVIGSPNNVVVTDPVNWRTAFQAIDEANLDHLYHILDSLQIR